MGGGPQASDRRDERRATRPYACQWPARAYRQPSSTPLRPKLARFWPGKAGTAWGSKVAARALQRPRKLLQVKHFYQYEGSGLWRRPLN